MWIGVNKEFVSMNHLRRCEDKAIKGLRKQAKTRKERLEMINPRLLSMLGRALCTDSFSKAVWDEEVENGTCPEDADSESGGDDDDSDVDNPATYLEN